MPPMPLLVANGLATADMGSTTRATKVACISVTASSIDTPDPSFRISTPKILAAHIAPYSLGCTYRYADLPMSMSTAESLLTCQRTNGYGIALVGISTEYILIV